MVASPPVTVAMRALEPVLRALAEAGTVGAKVLEEVGLEPSLRDGWTEQRDRRIETVVVDRLWEASARALNQPHLGLRLAGDLRPDSFDIFGYVTSNSATWGQGLRRAIDYFRLIGDVSSFALRIEGERAVLRSIRRPELPPGSRHPAEFTLAAVHAHARRALGDRWRVLGVNFEHPEPPEASEHRRVFEASVRFGARHRSLEFPARLLDEVAGSGDPTLGSLLEGVARDMIAALPSSGTWRERVWRAVADELRGEVPDRRCIASRLGVGERSLQRRLAEESTTFQSIVHDVRMVLARRYLERPELTLAEIGYLLGYSEPAAFHRAFKRHHGFTPSSVRAGRRA